MEKGINSLLRLYYDAMPKIEIVTITGDGTTPKTSSQQISISFSIAPVLLIYLGDSSSSVSYNYCAAHTDSGGFSYGYYTIFPQSLSTSSYNLVQFYYQDYNKFYMKRSSDGKTLYWYSYSYYDYGQQLYTNPLNASNKTYKLLGIEI